MGWSGADFILGPSRLQAGLLRSQKNTLRAMDCAAGWVEERKLEKIDMKAASKNRENKSGLSLLSKMCSPPPPKLETSEGFLYKKADMGRERSRGHTHTHTQCFSSVIYSQLSLGG